MERNVSFDIVYFNDCIQFAMEECKPLPCGLEQVSKAEKRLKYCLCLLHSFRLVHKDIKPGNIMYSKRSKGLVLVDFGISSVLAEKKGFKSQTFREGTFKYMSEEMINARADGSSFVDLYWNDAYAIESIFEQYRQYGTPNLKSFPRCDTKIGSAEDGALRVVYSIYTGSTPE